MERRIKVWDLAVRLFHWTLVLLFAVSYLTGESESQVHIYSGYGIIALLLFRIFWGFAGSRHARFTDFVKGPRAVLVYARAIIRREPIHFQGHNPLAGWMVLALLLSLSLSVWTGLELYATEGHGPLAGNGDELIRQASADGREDESGHAPGHEMWEELHEFFANFTLFLVILHIVGVAVSSRLHRENLVRAMISGYKKIPPGGGG